MVKKSDRKSERRHQQGIESRQRILDAAFELASERGYDGMTLSQVTKRAGVPAASIYWQFENKDELLAEVIEHNYREWSTTHTAWSDDPIDQPLGEKVSFAMNNVFQGLVDQPAFQRLGLMLALEHRVVELSARSRFRAVRTETRDFLAGWWCRVLRMDSAAWEGPARELADIMINISDGLLVAAQVDEGIDLERRVRLLSRGLTTIAEELLATSAPAGRPAVMPRKKVAAGAKSRATGSTGPKPTAKRRSPAPK